MVLLHRLADSGEREFIRLPIRRIAMCFAVCCTIELSRIPTYVASNREDYAGTLRLSGCDENDGEPRHFEPNAHLHGVQFRQQFHRFIARHADCGRPWIARATGSCRHDFSYARVQPRLRPGFREANRLSNSRCHRRLGASRSACTSWTSASSIF